MIGLALVLLISRLAWAPAQASDCVWVYRENPYAAPAACVEFAYPPSTTDQPFSFVEEGFGLTIVDAIRESQALLASLPGAPRALLVGKIEHTRAFQAWALRGSAHHLGIMHSWYRNRLRRDAPARAVEVRISTREIGMGLIDSSIIELGGRYALTSETPYHEYGHHLLEWERPGLMANRARFPKNQVGYGLIEAWANHFAFVLDSEPRFAEYQHSLTGTMKYAYSVDNRCSLDDEICDQYAFKVDESYQAVIVYGGLLWDLRRALGADESVVLMLNSLAQLDLDLPLGYAGAVEALVRADEERSGGANVSLIRSLAAARGL